MRSAPGKPSISARLILLFPGSLEIFTFDVWINFPIGVPPGRSLGRESRNRFQQFRDGKRPGRFHKSREQTARVFAVGNRILLSPKQFPGKELEVRVKCFARGGVIGGDQAVVDEDFDVLPVKTEFSAEAGLRFQTLARRQRRAGGLRQAVLIAAIEGSLTIVADAQAVAGAVDAVVSLVSD